MSAVDEALAIATIIIEGSRIVGDLVTLAIEVKHFKKECGEARDDCIIILELMRKNESRSVDLLTINRLKGCLLKCRTFLRQCVDDWGWLRATVEVIFRKKHEKLKQELKWALNLFTADALTTLLAGQVGLQSVNEGLQDYLNRQFQSLNVRDQNQSAFVQAEIRSISREVAKSTQVMIDMPQLGRKIQVFQMNDRRLQFEASKPLQDGLEGQLEGVGDIELCKLVDQTSATGADLPRLINIYSRLSERTTARSLWGILDASGERYAVMESLKACHKLEDLLASGRFSEFELTKRLRFAWEVCNAVTYFHSVNILLKSLSSQNVYVRYAQSGIGQLRPVLTDLENARLITESTIQQEYDVRFEAPDFYVEGQEFHTVYTDTWSLGVLILCCVNGQLPFNTLSISDDAGKAALRKQLSSSGLPCRNLEAVKPLGIQKVLQACFQSPAHLRPPAAWVSAKTLEVFSDISYENSLVVEISTPDSPEVLSAKERCYTLVCKARDQVHSRNKQLSLASEADIAILERGMDISTNANTDPMRQFLLGSLTWWRLARNSDWDRKLGIEDDVSRAKVVIEILQSNVTAGFPDAYFELSQAHKYLSLAYAEARENRKPVLGEAGHETRNDNRGGQASRG